MNDRRQFLELADAVRARTPVQTIREFSVVYPAFREGRAGALRRACEPVGRFVYARPLDGIEKALVMKKDRIRKAPVKKPGRKRVPARRKRRGPRSRPTVIR